MAESEEMGISPTNHSKTDLSETSASIAPEPEAVPAPAVDDIEKQAVQASQPTQEDAKDPNIVEWDGPNDKDNPKNWTVRRRIIATIAMGCMTFVVTFASSIFAVTLGPVSEHFQIGEVTAALGVALFLLGFVVGPVCFGPASEVWGRKVPLFFGYALFAIFQIPVAVAQNVETVMLGRFLSGLFASSPPAIVGGAMADMWEPVARTYAICCFAAATFCGPVVGPIVGGFVTENPNLGWRWTAWLTLILASLFGTLGLILIPETSAPRILQKRAKRLRFETKNWALHAKSEENPINVHTIIHIYLMRPWVMLVQEPILALLTAYMSYLYGVLYLLFVAYPISFHEDRGWSLGVSSLPFIAFIFGIFIGTGIQIYYTATSFKQSYIKYGKPIPEDRLPPMIIGAFLLPIGMFWFAWTSNPSIIWVPQVISSAFIGAGMLIAFWQGINYMMDCYAFYSNSAIAVNTFIRSICGAVFPLFAPIMYRNLGVAWATSLLGFICVAFIPAPILFYKYGTRIRAKSKWTPTR